MPYKRADRVRSLLQRELGTLISEELRDPRIPFATVTEVQMTDDLRTARVHVSVLGDDPEAEVAIAALTDAAPHIRYALGERTALRYVPQLEFVSDRTAARAARIARLLREAKEGQD